MNIKSLQRIVWADLFRYEGKSSWMHFFQLSFNEPGFRITLLIRLCVFTRLQWWSRIGIYHLIKFLYYLNSTLYNVHINFTTEIGRGLYIPHASSIVVNRQCKLGENCNISQNVTLGVALRGDLKGCPTIGDRVYIAPGAVIFGGISVGDDAAVGANCVVNRDIPDHGVCVGVPGRVISQDGSKGYVKNLCLT